MAGREQRCAVLDYNLLMLNSLWLRRSSDPPKVAYQPTWFDRPLDPIMEEWDLFIHPMPNEKWDKRCCAWEQHFIIYKLIKADDGKKGVRMDSLFQHLTILDSKFNMLLAITSIAFVGFNILLAHLKDLMEPFEATPYTVEVFLLSSVLSAVFGALGLWVIWLCLTGVRRLVWGDLGRDKPQAAQGDPNAVADAEEYYIKDLIVAVAKRTNRFRVAMAITWWNFWILCLILLSGLFLTLAPHFFIPVLRLPLPAPVIPVPSVRPRQPPAPPQVKRRSKTRSSRGKTVRSLKAAQ